MAPPNPQQVPAGIEFAATATTPAYIAMNQHRGGARRNRNRWSVPPPDEYGLFRTSHSRVWVCSNEHNWAVRSGLSVIGKNDERVAKFPKPQNTADPRHGYPVSARDPKRLWEHRPPPEVTSKWVAERLITDFQKNRIDRGKV